jgi:alpha-beta hydrolase superfamily lysophospholipase
MIKNVVEYTHTIGFKEMTLKFTEYIPDSKKPNGILHVVHGMTEHMGRYEELAEELTKYGIMVIGFDLPGHGLNATGEVASFGQNGWSSVITLLRKYNSVYGKKYNIPVYMMGFSLGSFLVREYINLFGHSIAGAIIMGTGTQPAIVLRIISALVHREADKIGFDNSSHTIRNLSFGQYNKKFAPAKTGYDWLCSDAEEIKKYEEDKLCIKDISAGLFHDMLCSMERTGNKEQYAYWNRFKGFEILLISGNEDAVGDNGKGVAKVAAEMKKFVPVEVSMYPGRHDVLHEKSNGTSKKVIAEIRDWLIERTAN